MGIIRHLAGWTGVEGLFNRTWTGGDTCGLAASMTVAIPSVANQLREDPRLPPNPEFSYVSLTAGLRSNQAIQMFGKIE